MGSTPTMTVSSAQIDDGIRVRDLELGFLELHGIYDTSDVRQEAEQALVKLATSVDLPAVLLVKEWQVLNTPFVFRNMAMYLAIAARSGFSLVTVKRPQEGGYEHLLFMVRCKNLTEAEYIDCLEDGGKASSQAGGIA